MPSVIARGAHVERAPEDAGEREHVVDLVREVRAPGRDDPGVPVRDVGVHLGVRVRQREDDRLVGAIDATTSSGTVPPETPMKTSAPASTSASEPRATGPVGGVLGERSLDRGQVVALGVEDALPVEHGEVADAGLEQDPGDRDAGRAGARDHDPGALAGSRPVSAQRVPQRGERHDRRAVLVVVEDRDVEQRP